MPSKSCQINSNSKENKEVYKGFTPLETIEKQKKAVMSLTGFTHEPVREPLTSFGFGTVQGFAPRRNPVKEEATPRTRLNLVRGTAVKPWSFTLLELLAVVIIISILAGIALPQYGKAIERARLAEALSVLGVIREAQLRYGAEYDVSATSFEKLGINVTTFGTNASKYFTFYIPATSYQLTDNTNSFLAYARRNGMQVTGGYNSNYYVYIWEWGNFTCWGGGCPPLPQ